MALSLLRLLRYMKNKNQATKMNLGGSVRLNPAGIIFVTLIVILLVYFNMGSGGSTQAAVESYQKMSNTVSLKSLLAVSIEMARRGGAEVKKIREQANIGEKSKGKTKEGANNPVTDGDMLSHRAMYHGLRKAFPNVNVISEEDDVEDIDLKTIEDAAKNIPEVDEEIPEGEDKLVPVGDVDVWIDPLDATQEYTENLLHYVTTMVCVAVKGRPVLGVIHKPFDQVTAWAWAGPNHVSKVVKDEQAKLKAKLGDVHAHQDDLSHTRIIVSRSHAGDVNATARAAFGASVRVEGAGGAGYKAWEVAKGNQDVYVHVTLIKKWDICAGTALLNALGGKMTALDGSDVNYSSKPALEVKNTGGVLATMHDHASYVDKLRETLKAKPAPKR